MDNVLLNKVGAPQIRELRDAMRSSGSGQAENLYQPALRRKEPTALASQRLGKKGKSHRRIIDYKRTGPFYRQVGTKTVADRVLPLMQTYWKHRFLHATKGWREYHGGQTIRIPRGPVPNWSRRATFYGRG